MMTKPSALVKNFFVPINGTIIKAFNVDDGHFGVDIISDGDQIINATLDGTVVFSSWSINNGYCIGIQHADSYFSVYKHNATLLKKEGDYVKAGEAMGYVQTYYGREEIVPARDGRVVAVTGKQGKNVVKGEIVAFVE